MDLKTRLARIYQRSVALLRDEGFFSLIIKIFKTLTYTVMIRANGGDMILIRYQEWLKKTGLLKIDTASQKTAIAAFPSHPLITIILYGDGRAEIGHLIDQTYPYWQAVLIVPDNTIIPPIDDDRLQVVLVSEKESVAGPLNHAASICEGEIVIFSRHGDHLLPNALFEVAKVFIENDEVDVVYSDEHLINKGLTTKPKFKPAFDLESLRAANYIGDLFAIRKSVGDKVGWFDPALFERSHYDLTLRAVEASRSIAHIPKILFERNAKNLQTPPDMEMLHAIVQSHLDRTEPGAKAESMVVHALLRISYPIKEQPLISILIPSHEHFDDLRLCLNSIWQKSTYTNYEIIILENNSSDPDLLAYYEEISERPNTRVLHFDEHFNYSTINNFGVQQAKGEYILLLNNDIEVITPNWLEIMLSHASRPGIGMVGARLYYPNDTIQHDGVVIGLGNVAGHINVNFKRSIDGYLDRSRFTKQFSAVTAACVLLRKQVYEEVGGLDPEYRIAYGDVDLSLRIRQQGYWIVSPFDAELYHYESKTRGLDTTREKARRFEQERDRLLTRGFPEISGGDPFYNPNLDLYMHNQLDWQPRDTHPRVLPCHPRGMGDLQ